MAEERKDRVGQTIDQRFRIDALIGRGATAEVYRALDLATQAYVAVKVLRDTHVDDHVSLARFAREADVQARIRHPNVAALLATGLTDRKEPYLALELLRGKSLRGVIKAEGRVPVVRAASYTWQALQGLAAVHEAGFLHRDLKPANIMLEPSGGPADRVVLIDFGFATFEGGAKLTMQGTVVGSLTYIAPERLTGEPPDARADLYAMGVIAFELLAGRPPFVAARDLDLIQMHVGEPPPSLRAFDPALPPVLDDLIACALAKRPADRFRDARAMIRALEAAAAAITG